MTYLSIIYQKVRINILRNMNFLLHDNAIPNYIVKFNTMR